MIRDIKYLKIVDKSISTRIGYVKPEQEFKSLNSLLHFLAFNENNVTYYDLQVDKYNYYFVPYMVLFYPFGFFYYRIYTNDLNKDTLLAEKIIAGYDIKEEMETLVKSYRRSYIIENII